MNSMEPTLMTVGELFDGSQSFIIPIYQRNYSWQAVQIEQLLMDIEEALSDGKGEREYFVGNMVVTRLKNGDPWEVIDGQQRLTTLHLLLTYLSRVTQTGGGSHRDTLRYASRAKASEALRRVEDEVRDVAHGTADGQREDGGIRAGYKAVMAFMDRIEDKEQFSRYLRDKVTLVLAPLPYSMDLNRYFEVMNTRGEQLQQVDIVKARLMRPLENEEERQCVSWIWDACADMDVYVQMGLTPSNTALRGALFGVTWSWLQVTTFEQLLAAWRPESTLGGTRSELNGSHTTSTSLQDALLRYQNESAVDSPGDEESVRFRSTIEFPSLLLHALKVFQNDTEENEGHLDDKRLIHRFMQALDDPDAERVRDFIVHLLRMRNLFDAFVLKRQFTTRDNEDGDWSMQRLIKYADGKGKVSAVYRNTFSAAGTPIEDQEGVADSQDQGTRDALLAESMLRVTFTSARQMHWITEVLAYLRRHQPETVRASDLVTLLEQHGRSKVASSYFAGVAPQGFAIPRVVFTYIDYLLARDGKFPDFTFAFRNSIEHFFPRNPDDEQEGAIVSESHRDLLGNLALVSVGANSKFSNSYPGAKAGNFRTTIVNQSPKLTRMADITNSHGWDDAQVQLHHEEMEALLRKDLGLKPWAQYQSPR